MFKVMTLLLAFLLSPVLPGTADAHNWRDHPGKQERKQLSKLVKNEGRVFGQGRTHVAVVRQPSRGRSFRFFRHTDFGGRRSALAHHQNAERRALLHHQLEERRLAQRGLIASRSLAQHQRGERLALERHQRLERTRIRW